VSTPTTRGSGGACGRLAVWILLLAAWEGSWRVAQWRSAVFPAPSHVADATLAMLNVRTAFGEPLHAGWPLPATRVAAEPWYRGELIAAQAVSLVRLAVGFFASVSLGGLFGVALWRIKWIDRLLGPLFLGLQTLPSVCWVPLAVLLVGLSEAGVLFVLVMGSFFAVATALRDGLSQLPSIYFRAARMLGARRWNLYRHVLLPASLPALAGALRQGFTLAWRSLMGAELIFMVDRHGVGYLLHVGRKGNDIAQVVAVMMVMVGIGMAADRLLFARLQSRVQSRFGLA